MLSAVASSSSIAAWAIWDELNFVWATIIAASQVINAIRQFLPFRRRLKTLNELFSRLDEISLESQKKWFSVCEGKLTEEEIHNLTMELQEAEMQDTNRIFGKMTLPVRKRILNRAALETDRYLQKFYS